MSRTMFLQRDVLYNTPDATNIWIRSEKESDKFPPAKASSKVALEKEAFCLNRGNIHTLSPMTILSIRPKSTGSRWMIKIRVDNSYKGRFVVLIWGHLHGVDCGSAFAPIFKLRSI